MTPIKDVAAIVICCTILIILNTAQAFLVTSPTLRCYKCDGAKSVLDCTQLETCQKSQICYAYKTYSEADSTTRFYGGCVDPGHCCAPSYQNSAVNKEMLFCNQSCDTDSCNNKLCGETVKDTSCFNCHKIGTSKTCTNITYCKSNEICGTFLYANNTVTYRCEDKMICQKAEQIQKRMSPEERYQLCGSCCSSDNCNASPSCSSTAGSTVKPIATTTPTAKTQATTAKVTQKPHNGPHGFRCEICSGQLCGVIKQDVKNCPTNTPYCINTINYAGMALTVTKGCASATTCMSKWWEQTSDRGECKGFDPGTVYANDFICNYCCRRDECNLRTNPISQGNAIMFHP